MKIGKRGRLLYLKVSIIEFRVSVYVGVYTYLSTVDWKNWFKITLYQGGHWYAITGYLEETLKTHKNA